MIKKIQDNDKVRFVTENELDGNKLDDDQEVAVIMTKQEMKLVIAAMHCFKITGGINDLRKRFLDGMEELYDACFK